MNQPTSSHNCYCCIFFLLAVSNLCCVGGGVPGGVCEGELSGGGLISRGGMHTKQKLPGVGPKFIPPQPTHGGVGGGVHGDGEDGHGLSSRALAAEVGLAGGEDG